MTDNEYTPWLETNETELEYWKRRYREERKGATMTDTKELIERLTSGYPGRLTVTHEAADALRELSEENERLAEERTELCEEVDGMAMRIGKGKDYSGRLLRCMSERYGARSVADTLQDRAEKAERERDEAREALEVARVTLIGLRSRAEHLGGLTLGEVRGMANEALAKIGKHVQGAHQGTSVEASPLGVAETTEPNCTAATSDAHPPDGDARDCGQPPVGRESNAGSGVSDVAATFDVEGARRLATDAKGAFSLSPMGAAFGLRDLLIAACDEIERLRTG